VVKTANCTYKEASEMPYLRAVFYLLLEEESQKRQKREMEEKRLRARRGRRY
jgi:hypothetical protein